MTTTDNSNNELLELSFDFNSLPASKQGQTVYLYEWLKHDGQWIEEGQPLYKIRVGKEPNTDANYISPPIIAKRSGIVQKCLKEEDIIQNGGKVCVIHPRGNYVNENIPSNKSYYFYFDKSKYNLPEKFSDPRLEIIQIKEWHKQDGIFVNQGELILTLGYSKGFGINDPILQYAEKSGYFDRVRTKLDFTSLKQNELVYVIHEKNEDRIKRKFVNESHIRLDEFTNKKIIKWYRVGDGEWHGEGIASKSLDRSVSLTFSFNNENEKDFIVFNFISKELMLSKDDIVSFLFENNKIIDFLLNVNSYKIPGSSAEKHFENKVLITDDELKYFEDHNLLKWKINIKRDNREIIGGDVGIHAYEAKQNLQIAIRKFAKEYRELVRIEIPNYVPLLQRQTLSSPIENIDSEECYVYLMIDTTNNHHKIGISNKPEWREKTLQSEKPTIELIASKKFIRRKIASSFEKALHETYSSKRIRGEWFQLDANEVNDIKLTLNS